MPLVLEGTWEEVAGQAKLFAGKRVRLTVISDDAAQDLSSPPLLSPEARARDFRTWAASHPARTGPVLTDEAMSRESIYFGDAG
jgi:hypothetical protein